MRKTCLNMVHELARRDERVVFIGSDLSPGLLDAMKAEMPQRHYMEGVGEANVIGMAAGMALDGYIPYVNTIATFLTRRCYEQVALDVCLHDLPVRLIANGGGVVYAPLGPTHLAVDDIAIMRAQPNMTVVAVSDADEARRLMEASLAWPHPMYIRLAKGGDKVISRAEAGFAIGKAIVSRRSAQPRAPLIVATGIATTISLEAAERLGQQGIDCTVLHMHTVKPLDEAALLELTAQADVVITVEEHSVIGGLGSAVTDCLVEHMPGRTPVIRRIGLPDAFAKNYGLQNDLLELAGITAEGVAAQVAEGLELAKTAKGS